MRHPHGNRENLKAFLHSEARARRKVVARQRPLMRHESDEELDARDKAFAQNLNYTHNIKVYHG